MYAYNLKKTSLLYRLIAVYSMSEYRLILAQEGDEPLDLCSLLKLVAIGLFFITLLVILVSVFLFTFVDLLIWVVVASDGLASLHEFTAVLLLLFGSVGGAFGLTFGIRRVVNWCSEKHWAYLRNQPDVQPKEPGFLALAWKSFHDKVCFKVNITE